MQEEEGAEGGGGGHREASCNIIDNENENVRCRSCTKRQSLGRRGVPGQPWKASSPTSTGLAGSVMSLNDVHQWKADLPISARLGGSVISLKDVQR